MWNPFRKKKDVSELIKDGSFIDARAQLLDELDESRDLSSDTHSKFHVLLGQIADLCLKQDQPLEAKKYYAELVDHHVERGFYTKAVAILKKMHRLDPEDPEVLTRIADFNRRVPKYMVNTKMAEELVEKSKEIESNQRAPRARRRS